MVDRRKNCPKGCPRFEEDLGHPCIFGVGPEDAKIMIVGENPGRNEDKQGIPFVGRSGELLNRTLKESGLRRDDIYVTNIVKCFTNQDDTKPVAKEIKACKKYLDAEIKRIQPTVIGALGSTALGALLYRSGISKYKNNVFMNDQFNIKVVPTYHPAHVLRNPGNYKDFVKGIEIISDEVKDRKILLYNKEKSSHIILEDTKKIHKALDQLFACEEFSFDVETNSLDYRIARILSIQFSWRSNTGIAIPWFIIEKNRDILERTKKLFATNKLKIGQNIKFDIQMLLAHKIVVKLPWIDTMLMHHVLDENADHDLDTLTLQYTYMGEYWAKLEKLKAKLAKKNSIKIKEITYDMFPLEDLLLYGAKDADCTFRLKKIFIERLYKEDLYDFFMNYVMDFTPVLVEAEFRGIKVNREKLKGLLIEYNEKHDNLAKSLYEDEDVKKYEIYRREEAGKKIAKKHKEMTDRLVAKYELSKNLKSRFPNGADEYLEYRYPGGTDAYIKKMLKDDDCKMNFNSGKQLQQLFFDQMGLIPVRKTKTGFSTDQETLEALEDQGAEIITKLLEHRKLGKYISTYLVSTYNKSEIDGRIHTNYYQHGTVSGRLSSKNPNMQNMPRKALDLKDCFEADPGYIFITPDLGQAEFRCWAHYSEDEDMLADIHGGLDIHMAAAKKVFNVPEEEVTKEMRTAAKNCVSGDTWIPTDNGFKKISTLKEGDQVLDQFNRTQTINETIKKNDDVYLVDTECGSLKCTKDHPLYTINENAELIFKPLEELIPGDYILACSPENRATEYITWQYKGCNAPAFKPLFGKWTLNPDLGYLIGFIVAEGTINKRSGGTNVEWTQKGKFVDYIDKLSSKIFGDRLKCAIDTRTGVNRWMVYSVEFVEFLEFIGLKKNKIKGMKNFPHAILRSPQDVQKAFLQGYFVGDGTFKNHRACVGTVSKELCDGVCLLLRNFGIYPKIYREHPKGGLAFYNIHITTNEELDILIKKIEVTVPESWTPPVQSNGRKFLHNVNTFYQTKHPDCNVRYHTKLRDHITHLFLKKNCLGVNPEIDKLIEHGIYSVRINSITKLGREKVYDFVTTGDKVMIANSFISLDCVFGLMYGRGSKSVAKQYGITVQQAEDVNEWFFERYPVAAEWIERRPKIAAAKGCVTTWFGRKRRLPNIKSDAKEVRAEAERQAKNSPIQGQVSDMTNAYMAETLKRAKKAGIDCFPSGQKHDEAIYQVKEEQKRDFMKIAKNVVETLFPDFKCKMVLEFEVGKTLGTLYDEIGICEGIVGFLQWASGKEKEL